MISPFLPGKLKLDDHRHRLLPGRADLAAGVKLRSTRIRHFLAFEFASLLSGSVMPLVIGVVALTLRALLMAPVGGPPLAGFPDRLAGLRAADLAPVTGPAKVKQAQALGAAGLEKNRMVCGTKTHRGT
jgi:hypothetical protein